MYTDKHRWGKAILRLAGREVRYQTVTARGTCVLQFQPANSVFICVHLWFVPTADDRNRRALLEQAVVFGRTADAVAEDEIVAHNCYLGHGNVGPRAKW